MNYVRFRADLPELSAVFRAGVLLLKGEMVSDHTRIKFRFKKKMCLGFDCGLKKFPRSRCGSRAELLAGQDCSATSPDRLMPGLGALLLYGLPEELSIGEKSPFHSQSG
jgi:hypothetical protein